MNRFSLLWPPGLTDESRHTGAQLGEDAWRDLGMDDIVQAFSHDHEHHRVVSNLLRVLHQDEEIIRYRQDVIEDLLGNPRLAGRLLEILPGLDSLVRYSYRMEKDRSTLHEIAWRLGELQGIVDCIRGLGEVLEEAGASLS